jgi:NAD+ synthase
MIPQTVKKIDSSKFRFLGGVFKVPTKTLAELNITEDEPFQIIDEGGSWDGKFAIVGEFWVNDWQTISIITDKQAEFYFTHLFKASEKKKEYDMLEHQSYFKKLNLELTEQQLFYIRHALELGFKQMPQDDKETYDGILKMFQGKIIMEKKYEFTPQLAFANIETHMKMWAELTNAQNFVVGISGGKDSTVVAMLLCAIFGKERVYGVMMPQGEQSDIQDSIDVCDILGIRHTTVNIGDSVSAITDEIYKNRSKSGIYPTKDMDINLPARIRMATLHAIGQCVDGRVINTSNLSEDMVGYATQFGDNAGAYAPLQGLTVTEVKELGKYLIDVLGISVVSLMTNLIDKTPVDGLQAQSDEERLGFTYADLDRFIRYNEGSDEFKEMIRKKYQQNKFKLEIVQMPQPDFSYLPNFVKD